MPREPRDFQNGEIYHIIQRGIEDKPIFLDENDYFRGIFSLYEFNHADPVEIRKRREERKHIKNLVAIGGLSPAGLNGIKETEKKRRTLFVEILAFCLMPNHIHLLLKQLKDNGTSEFMKKLGGYVSYFNLKYKRKGHLFQNQFKAVHIKDDEQFKTTFVYVHTNPASLVEPGWKERGIKDLAKTIEFIENYKWSSYADYIGGKNFPSLTSRDFLLEVMEGIDGCKKFVNGWLEYKVGF
ncbi:MAG: transposase [Candidatus Pacebacteria bacterium]|nr:transposase [Candidatus Paceibacterota bacterium]